MRELLLGNTAGAANQLRGPIPPGWQLPPNLQLLFLAGNPIGGPLSGGWALPRGLATLQVEGCNLTGPLPAIWGLPPALGTANFDGNQASRGGLLWGVGAAPGRQVDLVRLPHTRHTLALCVACCS